MRSFFAVLLLGLAVVAFADLRGTVVSVSDGDTLTIQEVSGGKKRTQTIRLEGIDAPELDQPFGRESRIGLVKLVHRKQVTVKVTGKDKYGRTLGFVHAGQVNVNHEMIRRGFAWWYRKYAPNNAGFKAAESRARSLRSGLWAAKQMPPWEWRHGGKVQEFLRKVRGKRK